MTVPSSELMMAEVSASQQQSDARDRPLRYSREVQGNVLAAFNKDNETFRLVRFKNRDNARQWLLAMLGHVSVTADVEQFNEQFSLRRRVEKADPKDLKAVWVSLALTYQGLETLVGAEQWNNIVKSSERTIPEWQEKVRDGKVVRPGFKEQMSASARAKALHDVGESDPEHWQFGGTEETTPHAVVIVAADDKDDLADRERSLDLIDKLTDTSLICRERGETLPGDLRGHEHFGFKDGVSQPGVKQFHLPEPGRPKGLEERRGHPGTVLIEPGEFVLGWPQEPRPPQEGRPQFPKWARDGSFLVLRKLRQDVPAFNELMRELATKAGVDPVEAGALMVGRYPDGHPLARPVNERRGWGPDLNDFDYHADGKGQRTPCCAHIRKTNPRAWHNTSAAEAKLEKHEEKGSTSHKQLKRHRIMRRGIPYGPPYVEAENTRVERGLLFVAYCASLADQFEFQQQSWANNHTFNPGEGGAPTGHDPIIGAGNDGNNGEIKLVVKGKSEPVCHQYERAVHTRGAVYAFTPSMSTLRKLAGGESL